MDGLIERLLAQDPFRISNDGMTVAELPPPGKLRNPDGPEAADALQSLSERNAELEGENERLSKAVCSGVLGDLLSADENEALVAFVKELRQSSLTKGGK